MAEILSLADARNKREKKVWKAPSTLDEWVNHVRILNEAPNIFEDQSEIVTCKDIDQMCAGLEQRLTNVLIDTHCIQTDYFLCAQYVANILAHADMHLQDGLYVFERLTQQNWQSAGNLAFILVSIFPDRTNRQHRPVTEADYRDMGMRAFMQHYEDDPRAHEIGYHMSRHFDDMVTLTRKSVPELCA